MFAFGYGQSDRFPAWYHNLRANPEATSTVKGPVRSVVAYEAEGEERDRLWREGLRRSTQASQITSGALPDVTFRWWCYRRWSRLHV